MNNRRWFMKEGTVSVNPFGKIDKVKMNPPVGSPNLTEPAGPTDPTISFIALREPGGRLISIYSAYSLHYVGGVGSGEISADYYGMFCQALAKLQIATEQEPPFVAIMANGTSGEYCNPAGGMNVLSGEMLQDLICYDSVGRQMNSLYTGQMIFSH